MQPHVTDSRYVNYLSGDDSSDVARAYGPNWSRLVAVKQRHDPENLVHNNLNIVAGSATSQVPS